jgi:3-hydroxyisobutyrate dehydrogenase-like beta-hydroxyacid dehydrogenase
MKVGFIGLGRMGQAMARRLLEAKHDVGVYNRTPEKIKDIVAGGAKSLNSIEQACRYGTVVFSMLADDAALAEVSEQNGGLLQSLPKGGIHICSGTHGVAIIKKLTAAHKEREQIFVAAPVLARPEMVASGQAAAVGRRRRSLAASRYSMPSGGAHLRPAPIRPRRRRSRSPTILCWVARSRQWAKDFRLYASTGSFRPCSTRS